MIINGKESSMVGFSDIFFSPNFNKGQRSGFFRLYASCPDGMYLLSSPIVDIHELEGNVYVETQHSLYQVVPEYPRQIRPRTLNAIKTYLKDPNYTSKKFYDEIVPNRMPTTEGWSLF